MKCPVTSMSVLLILCVVYSCSKSSNDHANEGTVLKRYTTTFGDTLIYYYIYDRDANNKIISMRDSTKAYESKETLTYGSNGKVEKVTFINNGSAMYSFEFEYNADGRISKRKTHAGTLNVGEDYNVYVYDAAGHLITDSSYSTVNNRTFYLHEVSKFKYTGENITEAEKYTVTNGTVELDTWFKYEYDNGINPFKDLEYEYYINEGGSAIYTILVKSSNNVLKSYIADGYGGWDILQSSTYQYNSSKFAWKTTTHSTALNQPPMITEYFFQ